MPQMVWSADFCLYLPGEMSFRLYSGGFGEVGLFVVCLVLVFVWGVVVIRLKGTGTLQLSIDTILVNI